ncbi:hypothetical protein B0T17DRAFT_612834 [Bombardia bombarda]|uniref:F-box domain-containing protein n=1 Tax=Bombardia bombarda TaxID=252184 RepID=A0AA39XL61_9PEZI|nr:hypothetical protein B0T17DRAFT_612834 [Bombardia bombarda]
MGHDLEPSLADTVMFSSFPFEILELIFRFTNHNDQRAIRLTCRAFEPPASSLVFRRLVLSNSRAHLLSFLSVASTPRLRVHVRELAYDEKRAPLFYEKASSSSNLQEYFNLHWLSNFELPQQDPTKAESAPGNTVMDGLVPLFLTAIDALPNLHTVISVSPRPQQRWGSKLLETCLDDGLFRVVLPACRQSGNKPLRLVWTDEFVPLYRGPSAARLHWLFDATCFEKITDITLSFRLGKLAETRPYGGLICFLQGAMNLRKLSLSADTSEEDLDRTCYHRKRDRDAQAFFDMLALAGESKFWKDLASLELVRMVYHQKSLIRFLKRHSRTLRRLTLHRCKLEFRTVKILSCLPHLHLSRLEVKGVGGWGCGRVKIAPGYRPELHPQPSHSELAVLRFEEYIPPARVLEFINDKTRSIGEKWAGLGLGANPETPTAYEPTFNFLVKTVARSRPIGQEIPFWYSDRDAEWERWRSDGSAADFRDQYVLSDFVPDCFSDNEDSDDEQDGAKHHADDSDRDDYGENPVICGQSDPAIKSYDDTTSHGTGMENAGGCDGVKSPGWLTQKAIDHALPGFDLQGFYDSLS